MKLLHFADAHIDMQNYGRHDPASGLPLRVLDFLKSLDAIVDAAIREKVDLVIFAGDAYKDRSPAPTFQREWGRRIMRLSQARIPTLLLVGNHDLAPAIGKAHAIQEFDTLNVPYVRVLAKPELLGPARLWDLPLQVIAWPWLSRSALIASRNLSSADPAEDQGEGVQMARPRRLAQQQDLIARCNLLIFQVDHELIHADPSHLLISSSLHDHLGFIRHASKITIRISTGDGNNPYRVVAFP